MADKNNMDEGSFNKDEWIEMKKKEKEAAFDTVNYMLEACGREPDTFRKYLAVQGRFPVSVSNALLITAQKPEATRLDDFETWKERKMSIAKGERAVVVLESVKIGETEDGKERRGFRTKKLFDVSQTSRPGEEVIHFDEKLLLRGLMKGLPCKIVVREGYEGEAFFDEKQNVIAVQDGLPAGDLFSQIAACAQLAVNHALNDEDFPWADELEAKCVGYVLCSRYGVKPQDFSDEEAGSVLAQLDAPKIKAFLSNIRMEAYELGKDVEVLVRPEKVVHREEAR